MERPEIEKLTDKDVAVYSLYILGGWQKRIHTEDIALKCYELSRSRFSWVKYPQYPDPAPARFALEAAKKAEFGALVEGESEKRRTKRSVSGWRLTDNGVRWIEANKSRIEQRLGKRTPPADRIPEDRRLKELLRSVAFRKFERYGQGTEISRAEFAESLICTVNTRVEILNECLKQLYSIGEELKREDVKKFVDFCRSKFASLLKEVAKDGEVWNSK
jgi:hypothetical protein